MAVQEEDGHSWSNRGRVEALCNFAKDLVSRGKVLQREIRVITMYVADVSALEERLSSLNLSDIHVRTVDSIQSRQEKII